MKPQSRDSYQPRASGDHSKRWTLIGEGSREDGKGVRRMMARAWLVLSEFALVFVTVVADEAVLEDDGRELGGSWDPSSAMRVRIVWSGSSGCHDSIHSTEGWNVPPFAVAPGVKLCRLDMLFCRLKDGAPTGILPRAFSDMPRSCGGTSSVDDGIGAPRHDSTDCLFVVRFG